MSRKQENNKKNDWGTLKRLMAYFNGEQKLIILTIVTLIFYASTSALGPMLIARAIDENITTGDLEGLSKTMLTLLGVYVFGLLMMRYQLRFLGTLGQKILLKLRGQIFSKMQKLSLAFYHKNEAGDLMSRLINDTDSIGTLFSQSIVQTLGSVVSLIAILIAMFSMNVELSLVAASSVPLMIILSFYFARISRKAFAKSRRTLGDLSSNIEENLRLVRESQAFVRQAINISDFDVDNANNRDANVQAVKITSIFAPTIDILSTLAMVAVIGYGSSMAFEGTVTIGLLVAFLSYSQRFYRPIQMMATFYTQLQSTLAAADRVFSIIDEPAEDEHLASEKEMPEIQGEVAFEHVHFGYEDNQHVLQDMSFTAREGETIAFIGETGVGKSTTINLIPRYYDVQRGAVKIDGENISKFSLHSIRKQISEVPQSSYLFAMSIADNISFGDENPQRDRIIEAAKSAQCHDFITKFKNGYDTIIGEEGVRISQGQKQLLCIARALYSDPKILLLDEATSSIDTQTEKIVQDAIAKVLEDRTAFIIAHRLSTISQVDTIITLGKEGIIEKGSPEELRESGGYYSQMLEKQY